MKKHTSIQDRVQARRKAQAAKRDVEYIKPPGNVACACGCGTWPERDMVYYVDIDDGKKPGSYYRKQSCADKVNSISRRQLVRWYNEEN